MTGTSSTRACVHSNDMGGRATSSIKTLGGEQAFTAFTLALSMSLTTSRYARAARRHSLPPRLPHLLPGKFDDNGPARAQLRAMDEPDKFMDDCTARSCSSSCSPSSSSSRSGSSSSSRRSTTAPCSRSARPNKSTARPETQVLKTHERRRRDRGVIRFTAHAQVSLPVDKHIYSTQYSPVYTARCNFPA